ncbi:hypothetical protein AVEN_88949-1 [Araneus ventricosus]|uniref:Uncharacterized protein n=1 Tax=Araneus ventricosus TaxID=182803 RepID=A0A4Y2DL71_ARAVE|nr:hypothetical protein AVEN_88949-1 [Araneus ventricosus]
MVGGTSLPSPIDRTNRLKLLRAVSYRSHFCISVKSCGSIVMQFFSCPGLPSECEAQSHALILSLGPAHEPYGVDHCPVPWQEHTLLLH